MDTDESSIQFRVGPIDHVELFVPRRREAAEWYRQTLGLEIVAGYEHWAEDPNGPLMISSDGGVTKLALFRGTPQGERGTAGFHLVAYRLRAAELLRFLDLLPDLDLVDHHDRRVTADLLSDHGQAFSIYFCDPWGHHLELTTYEHQEVRAALA